ncbi:hypothetical protein MP228_002997 [Amoeboaphelidium protococcarum]|nr:hypothetical protein MP228_002997 [Amoeboaphelidium protococcarum]
MIILPEFQTSKLVRRKRKRLGLPRLGEDVKYAWRGNLCSFPQDVQKAMTVAEVLPLPCKDLSDYLYARLVGSNVPDHISTQKDLPKLLHLRRAVSKDALVQTIQDDVPNAVPVRVRRIQGS